MEKNPETSVVVTGLGYIGPLGFSVSELWPKLLAGESGITSVSHDENLPVKVIARLSGFNPLNFMDRRMIHDIDPFSQYAISAHSQLCHDSSLEKAISTDPYRHGVVIGTGMGGLITTLEQYEFLKENKRTKSNLIPKTMPNAPAYWIAKRDGRKGPSFCTASACASGSDAIASGYEQILLGRADTMITGGTEAIITGLGIAGFYFMTALSRYEGGEPGTASRPFDLSRDGFVVGEGSGILRLERESFALRRHAPILARLSGYGRTTDAADEITKPYAESQAEAMKIALRTSGIMPEEVDYINAHGTATRLNDQTETAAIKQALGEHANNVAISATKSMTGHLIGGAGALGAIVAVKTILDGWIHPTINLKNPDPECNLNYVPNDAIEKKVDTALSNAFAFGGHNVVLVFQKYAQ